MRTLQSSFYKLNITWYLEEFVIEIKLVFELKEIT